MNINGGKSLKKTNYWGFLARIAKNQAGNVMPLMAAAVFPMAAMVGGAVDLSRIYMTRTRLQNACDAGALAARRSMSGQTPTTADINEGKKFFNFNFPTASFGVKDLQNNYTQGATVGTISGTASAVVPASVMKIFGQEDFNVSVNCSSTLNIPNTDVVFVLDTSGSMAQTISGDTQSKIAGLRQAVKDFFVELGPGEASGPGRIRYGFVPYSSGVNVGRILNPDWVVNSTNYRTKVPTISQVWTYSLGSESGLSAWSAWSPSTMPTSFNTSAGFTGWALLGTTASSTITVSGVSYRYRHATATTSATCTPTNNLAGSSTTMIARTDVSGSAIGPALQSTTNNPATYSAAAPPSQQVLTYNQQDPHTVTGYRYRWQSVSGTNGCWLERATGSYTRTQTATSTKSITWLQRDRITAWTQTSGTINVSGLKNGTGWNASFSAANTSSTTGTYNVSGIGSTSLEIPVATTVAWRGCIEEAQSVNTITATSAIAIPSTAYDMQIDLVPSTDAQRWKPHLPELVWDSTDGQWQGDATWQSNGWAACPSAASKLSQYTSDVVSGLSTSFSNYVNNLAVIGGTQHDIGMVWGARMLSPDGIYSSENNDAQAPGGFQIGRHIVFMTDGTMDARNQNYGPWGISRLDGRQVPTNQLDTDDGSADMNNKHYRRMEMICNAAKAKGYTVWVVGFGISSLPQSLINCATDSDHAAVASSSTALKAKFKAIAETIGGLRLSV